MVQVGSGAQEPAKLAVVRIKPGLQEVQFVDIPRQVWQEGAQKKHLPSFACWAPIVQLLQIIVDVVSDD